MEINPDIALLQEVNPPHLFLNDKLLYLTIGGSRDWGSAICTINLPVNEIPIQTHNGWVVVGRIDLPKGGQINVVSIHGEIKNNSVVPNLMTIFENLVPILEERNLL